MKLFFTLLLVFASWFTLHAQNDSIIKRNQVDSNGKRDGFWGYPSAMTLVKNGRIQKGVTIWQFGYYRNGRTIGNWIVKNDRGRIVGFRTYTQENDIVEVQLKGKRIRSIIYYENVTEDQSENSSYQVTSVLSFGFLGRLKEEVCYPEINEDSLDFPKLTYKERHKFRKELKE